MGIDFLVHLYAHIYVELFSSSFQSFTAVNVRRLCVCQIQIA